MTDLDQFPQRTSRDRITSGLRQLADYLDANPDVPVAPYGWDLLISTQSVTDTDGAAEVDRIAARLGVPVKDDRADGGHYTAVRAFGPIVYRAFHIPARTKAVHHALMSYADSVTPDDPPQAA